MVTINTCASGMLGDFIQQLYALKWLCYKNDCRANLYLVSGHHGDVWTYGAQKAYEDLKDLVMDQEYIESFQYTETPPSDCINLNMWRLRAAEAHSHGGYNQCWTEILRDTFDLFYNPPSAGYYHKWLTTLEQDDLTRDKIVIHRSKHRHNNNFPWTKILRQFQDEDIFFLTTNRMEWELFPHRAVNLNCYIVDTVDQMAQAISGCRYFIGNQSAPFSLACALEVNRLVELDSDPAAFYMGEERYTDNISWYLNREKYYFSKNSLIKL